MRPHTMSTLGAPCRVTLGEVYPRCALSSISQACSLIGQQSLYVVIVVHVKICLWDPLSRRICAAFRGKCCHSQPTPEPPLGYFPSSLFPAQPFDSQKLVECSYMEKRLNALPNDLNLGRSSPLISDHTSKQPDQWYFTNSSVDTDCSEASSYLLQGHQ